MFEVGDCLTSFQPHRRKNRRKNTERVFIDIFTRHAFLNTLIITEKGSLCVAEFVHEIAEKLGFNLKHGTTEHARTIGVLERAHATIKISLKMASSEYRKQRHKHLPIAFLNYNTTYHCSVDFEPGRVFRGRVQHSFLDDILGYDLIPISHLLRILQKKYSAEPKFYMTKPGKVSSSPTSTTRDITTKQAKDSP